MKTHENVMLITMSTLPSSLKCNTYKINEGGNTWYFKSWSQMEPHTKYVIRKLADDKEVLDRIVILESKQARTESPESCGGETATSLFIKRIKNYLGRSEKILVDIPDYLEEIAETELNEKELYGIEDACGAPEIITVDLSDPIYFWNAVMEIRGEKLNEKMKTKVHLYMDMQGGDRNSVSQMNAIVELLKRQGVSVKGRYANDYKYTNEPRVHTIREVSNEYSTYDLISAMDAFTRYGWGDGLKEFFTEFPENSKEDKLIKAINKASSAISKCNADGFDDAVKTIEELKKHFKKSEKKTQMDVVFQDIEQDYAPLFNAKYRYVAQVRWCLDKKFLQQALTIFEAKMPNEFILSGLIYYLEDNAPKQVRQDFLKKCEEIYKALPKKERYRMIDLNHYLIKDYCNGYDSSSNRKYFCDPENLLHFGLGEGESEKNKVLNMLDEYRNLSNLRNQMNHASVGGHNKKGFFNYMKNRYPRDGKWKENKEIDYEKKIRDYLDKWEELSDNESLAHLRGKILDLS